MNKIKLFLELIQKGLDYQNALKGADVTEEEVKGFLNENAENVTPEQLSEQVAAKVLETLEAKVKKNKEEEDDEKKQGKTIDLSKVVADEIKAAVDGLGKELGEQLKKIHPHINTNDGAGNGGTPAVHDGKTLAYKRLHPYQRDLVDMLDAARKGAKGIDVTKELEISITDGEKNQIIADRKAAGLSGAKANGKHVTVFGKKQFRQIEGKALDSTAGDGAEYIPTTFADMLHLRLGEISSIANTFPSLTMSSAAMTLPLATVRPTVYGETAVTASGTESSPTTSSASLAAKDFIGKSAVHDNTLQDTAMVVNLLPFIEQMLVESMGNAFANAIINGDSDGTHMDSDIEAVSKHHAKLFPGLRWYALNGSGLAIDFATGGFSIGNLESLIAAMGKYSVEDQATACRMILGVKGVTSYRSINHILDPQTPGGWSALTSGSLPPLLGIAPIVESQNRESLNASGVYDGVTTTKGCTMIYNSREFLAATWKNMTMEVERVASERKQMIYATMRKDFKPFETPGATVPSVVMGYNYTA